MYITNHLVEGTDERVAVARDFCLRMNDDSLNIPPLIAQMTGQATEFVFCMLDEEKSVGICAVEKVTDVVSRIAFAKCKDGYARYLSRLLFYIEYELRAMHKKYLMIENGSLERGLVCALLGTPPTEAPEFGARDVMIPI